MIYKGNTLHYDKGYVAPFLGNGTMTFQVDFEGTMQYTPKEQTINNNPDLRIWQAGRRYTHDRGKELIPFGRFEQRIFEGNTMFSVEDYEQELDLEKAEIRTSCKYRDKTELNSRVYLHHDCNLISIKKIFKGTEKRKYEFIYRLCDINTSCVPELLNYTFRINKDNSFDIEYKIMADLFRTHGVIRIFSDCSVKAQMKDNCFILETELEADKEANFYILFRDSVDGEDYIEKSAKIKEWILANGDKAAEDAHRKAWQAYYDEGWAEVGNKVMDDAYKTAQYHLKCYTTKWTVPVGLNNGSWHGRCFAFDEFYMLMGLLTSNHLTAARKIPKFRADGLPIAVKRTTSKKRDTARYPWETLEDGSEGAVDGFWKDHIFHMASIACGEYYYYKFTNDVAFLREVAYPVLKNCATFYIDHAIYKVEGGKTIIGRCTDLERLGSSAINPYMTTCGVIKTFKIFAEAAGILGKDKELADECLTLAEELFKGLPHNGERYIPYAGCEEISIGLISGTYPFDVIPRDSELQRKGLEAYLESEQSVGNMYNVGRGVCSWYMAWKSLVFARHLRKEEAFEAAHSTAVNTGHFGEMYEINDDTTDTYFRPWFTTAAGMLMHAVNEILLQSDDENIYIAPALPESEKSFSFKLAAYGDMTVEAEAADGVLTKLHIIKGRNCKKDKVRVVVPDHFKISENILNNTKNNVYEIIHKGA